MAEFAALAGISERNARDALARCHSGKTWRGFSLEVRKVNGKAYQVNPLTLPDELRQAWNERQPKQSLPAVNKIKLPALFPVLADVAANEIGKQEFREPPKVAWLDDALWKEKLIIPALEHRANTLARGGIIKEIAGRAHVLPDGRTKRFSLKTINNWITAYEKLANETGYGLPALIRRHRTEEKPRVFLSRRFDMACPLPEEQKQLLAATIGTYIKSLWAEAGGLWPKIENLAASKLQELCRESGWPTANMDECSLGRYAIERYAPFGRLHTKHKNAKKHADKFKPRIRLDHSKIQPMEVVVGDVHPVDIVVERKDGSPATYRLIAWYDLATHRLFPTLVLLEKGQGITQADVWASFAAMVSEWGLPEHLYLDNGSEYNGKRSRGFGKAILDSILDGFKKLAALASGIRRFTAEILDLEQYKNDDENAAREGREVIRALPYNAAAKAIEGAFSNVEKVLSLLPGYIGGDRMNQRIPKLGKKTKPYQDPAKFEADFDMALKWYHLLPQQGNLKGKTPNQSFSDYMERGWGATEVDRIALICAMSEEKTIKVQNNGIELSNAYYMADVLIPFIQSKVTVRYAKWAPDMLIFLPNAPDMRGLEAIPLNKAYVPLDQAGAKEQSRREGIMNRHLRDMKAETEKLDMVDEITRSVKAAAPAPKTKFSSRISLGAEVDALEEKNKALPAPKPEKVVLQPGEELDKETSEVSHFMDRFVPPRNFGKVKPLHNPFSEMSKVAEQYSKKKQGAGR